MQPIHELLKRIYWDAEFKKDEFELAFLERLDEGCRFSHATSDIEELPA